MNTLKNILLVDDNPLDRELILEALREIPLTNNIIEFTNGQEVIDYLFYQGQFANREKDLPAVVLLDIKMPKMSGIEALQKIKSNPELKNIPVVMLTSSREDSDLKKCYELGTNAYVVKPIDFAEFSNAVKNVGLFWGLLNEHLT